jgi:hypothetical protein
MAEELVEHYVQVLWAEEMAAEESTLIADEYQTSQRRSHRVFR